MIIENILQGSFFIAILSAIFIFIGKIQSEYRLDRDYKISYYIDGFIHFLFLILIPIAITIIIVTSKTGIFEKITQLLLNHGWLIIISLIILYMIAAIIFQTEVNTKENSNYNQIKEIITNLKSQTINKLQPILIIISSIIIFYLTYLIYNKYNLEMFLIILAITIYIQTLQIITLISKNQQIELISIQTNNKTYKGRFIKNIDNYIEIYDQKSKTKKLINKTHIICIDRHIILKSRTTER